MPILKFWEKNGKIILDKLRMENITHDKRTALINKASFTQEQYKIGEGVYIAVNDTFFKMAKIFNKETRPISAMLIEDKNNSIVIVPERSYVFWNGCSIEPEKYSVIYSDEQAQRMCAQVQA